MEDSLEVEEDLCNLTAANHTVCGQDDDELITDIINAAKVIVPVTLGAVLLAGVIGNVLLLLYIARGKRRKSPYIILIASLTVSDLLMLLIGMPFVSTLYTFESWPYGEFICKLSEFAQTLSAAAEVFNLTALSVDRYFLFSMKKSHLSRKSSHILLSCIWISSIIFALPDLVSSTILSIGSLEFCIVYPESFGTLYREIHVSLKFLLLFIIPMLTISTFYILIGIKLGTIEELTPATNTKHVTRDNLLRHNNGHHLRRKKRLTFIIFVLVIVFLVTWLPRYVYLMWFHFDSSDINTAWFVFKIVSFCLMFTSSLINPYIYCALDDIFKCFVLKLCGCGERFHASDVNSSDSSLPDQLTMTVMTENLPTTE